MAVDFLEIISRDPLNAGTPLAALRTAVTPSELVYIRSHFAAPELSPEQWALKLSGRFRSTMSWTLEQLQKLPAIRLRMVLECAGNSRTEMSPLPPGVPWRHNAVSIVEFTGASLSSLLAAAGLEGNTRYLSFQGADRGEVMPGRTERFVRGLNLETITRTEPLLAWEMNRQPLTLDHGAPLRLVVPGWYGMASVKWLREIIAQEEPVQAYFQTEHYLYDGEKGTPDGTAVTAIRVRSFIATPTDGATVPGKELTIAGIAWSAGTPIAGVAVSVDGGGEWISAELSRPECRYDATRWQLAWIPPGPGRFRIMVRATDSEGETQPLIPRWNRQGYGNNGVHQITVTVA